jgi:hypothetical protein
MSVNPVPTIDLTVGEQSANTNLQKRPSANPEVIPAQPDPGTSPKQEASSGQPAPISTELRQDEVQVQRNSETNGEVVIKYLDHFGNLIVQMPSSQMLGVTRAIDRDFQQKAKVRESEETAALESKGGVSHGD